MKWVNFSGIDDASTHMLLAIFPNTTRICHNNWNAFEPMKKIGIIITIKYKIHELIIFSFDLRKEIYFLSI